MVMLTKTFNQNNFLMQSNIFSKKAILGIFILFSFNILRGQDGTANINLDRDESIKNGFYSKKNGLWLISETKSMMLNGNRKLMKYSPDLKKTEWSIDLKGIYDWAIYDVENPDYLYFRAWVSPAVLGNPKQQLTQVTPTGKVSFHEYIAEETSNNMLILSFCSMNQYCEVWKKKDANELLIAKWDNQTFKLSKSMVRLPTIEKDLKLDDWVFNGISDSLLLLSRHNHKTKQQQEIQAYLINIKNGSLKSFYFKPTFKLMKEIAMSYYEHDVFAGVKIGLDNNKTQASRFQESDYFGNLRLARDGKSIYYYCFANFSGKNYSIAANEPKIEGIQVSKLDLNGKTIWQQETKFTEEEIGNLKKFKANPNGTLMFKEFDDKTIGMDYHFLETAVPGVAKSATIGIQYNDEGKKISFCTKDFKTTGGVLKDAKTKVNSIEELYPCFITNTARMTKYVEQKKFNAKYTVFTDNGSHILTILPNDERVVGLIYFKN